MTEEVSTASRSGADLVFEFILRFVAELRASGLPLSTADAVDAMSALEGVSLTDLRTVRACLQATLVTSAAHESVFGLVFGTYFDSSQLAGPPRPGADSHLRPLVAVDDDEILELLARALESGDRPFLGLIARETVPRHSRMVSGRASGVNFHTFKALRPLDVDGVLTQLDQDAVRQGRGDVERLLRREDRMDAADFLTREVRAEVRRRLVEDRGPEAVGRTLRTPLPEDVDFLRASTEQLADMERAVAPLGRRLARKLARRQASSSPQRINFAATNRASLAFGGVPAELHFHRPRPRRSELVVIADVSGSVASFASFTLQLIMGLRSTFAQVRTFAFIDGIDEVTDHLARSRNVTEAVHTLNSEADIIWHDGHSDYGNALSVFWDRWGNHLGRRTTVLVLGDARNNYLAPESDVLARIRRRVGGLYWLNPEPRDRWDTGDSVISEYGRSCDAVVECRNLRQLENFVGGLG